MPKHSNHLQFSNPYYSAIQKLIKKPIQKEVFFNILTECDGWLCESEEETYHLLCIMGAPLVEQDNYITLKTSTTSFNKQQYCFIDIESNGSDLNKSQIIEIGAILYQENKIIDTFESLVFCEHIPKTISELTGITLDDVVDAPTLEEVLPKLRAFLHDSVLVAHNALFDFNFLNAMLYRHSMGWLCNRFLCTIQLAQKTIASTRYNLAHLNNLLNIKNPVIHRAYADSLTALKIFEKCMQNIPNTLKSTEDLIAFSKS